MLGRCCWGCVGRSLRRVVGCVMDLKLSVSSCVSYVEEERSHVVVVIRLTRSHLAVSFPAALLVCSVFAVLYVAWVNDSATALKSCSFFQSPTTLFST